MRAVASLLPCTRLLAFTAHAPLPADSRHCAAQACSRARWCPLQDLSGRGYKLVVFSNQSLIGALPGGQQQSCFQAKMAAVQRALAVSPTALVATLKDGNRKPRLGMWSLFTGEYNGDVPVDLRQSFYVGDAAGRPGDHSADDLNFARAIGLPFLLPEQVFGPSA